MIVIDTLSDLRAIWPPIQLTNTATPLRVSYHNPDDTAIITSTGVFCSATPAAM